MPDVNFMHPFYLDELFEDPDPLVLLRDGLEGGVTFQLPPDVLPRRLLAHVALVQQVPEGRLQLLPLPHLLLDPLAVLRLGLLLQRGDIQWQCHRGQKSLYTLIIGCCDCDYVGKWRVTESNFSQ